MMDDDQTRKDNQDPHNIPNETLQDYADAPADQGVEDGFEDDELAPDDAAFTPEDEEFVDEDWEGFDDEFAGDPSEQMGAPVKKSSNFNKIVIAGGVVLGLVVMVMSMGGAPPEGTTQQNAAPPQQSAAVAPSQPQDSQTEGQYNARDTIYGRTGAFEDSDKGAQDGQENAGMFNDPDAIEDVSRELQGRREATRAQTQQAQNAEKSVEAAESDLPMPAPIAGGAQSDDVLTPMAFEEPIPDTADAQVSDVMQGNRIPRNPDTQGDELPKAQRPSSDRQSATDVSAQSERNVLESSAGSVDNEALASINGALDQIVQRLDRIEQRQSDLEKAQKNMQEQSQPASSDAMERALDGLARRMTELEKSMATRSEAPVASVKTDASERRRPTAQKDAAPQAASSAPDTKAPASQTRWVLKAAQPGRAMVAQSGSSETYDVAVGDSLAGIGKIEAIRIEDGRWLVQGSKGRIMQ